MKLTKRRNFQNGVKYFIRLRQERNRITKSKKRDDFMEINTLYIYLFSDKKQYCRVGKPNCSNSTAVTFKRDLVKKYG